MEKSQSEITLQIRSSIKQKLGELNAFIDDELPDYIMILVANKRSKAHMEKDLGLFLGDKTVEFTNWLWGLVNNIKVKPKQTTHPIPAPVIVDESSISSKRTDDDADVLNYDLNEQEAELEPDDDNNNLISLHPQLPDPSKIPNKIVNRKPKETKTFEFGEKKISSKARKVYKIETISGTRPVAPPEVETEYDPTRPDFGTVSSVVHVSPNKHLRRTPVKANKMLLRAVNDATKSILDGKTMEEFYKPTPIELLSANKQIDTRREFYSLLNVNGSTSSDFDSLVLQTQINRLLAEEDSSDSLPNVFEKESDIIPNSSKNSRTIFLESKTVNVGTSSDKKISKYTDILEEENEMMDDPHFIVTLDGVDFASLKRKHVEVSDDESMEVDEDLFGVKEEESPEKKLRITERCKYWPACKNSESCRYHHPTIPCKCFPECKYGEKCLYIHPNCKFDALCSRKDCPFTHVSKRKFPPQVATAKSRSTKIVCRFHPKCTAKSCPFIHPKLCRYGNNCRLPGCAFSHFNIPARNQLKWKAGVL